MSMTKAAQIAELRGVIHRLHGGKASHVESVPVKETFQGQTVWDGIVEVFDLAGHSKANRIYAWSHDTGDPVQSQALRNCAPHPARLSRLKPP